jgi:hypothetical protein
MHPTTSRAPRRLSVAASSFSLAPVVSTSSTTATFLPSRSSSQTNALRTFAALSLHGSDACGALSRLRLQPFVVIPRREFRADPPRDPHYLIESALAQAPRRQWHRHHWIGIGLGSERGGERTRASQAAAVFQRAHQHLGRKGVSQGRDHPIKCRASTEAASTNFRSHAWRRTDRAARHRQTWQRLAATLTQTVGCAVSAAPEARRWQQSTGSGPAAVKNSVSEI